MKIQKTSLRLVHETQDIDVPSCIDNPFKAAVAVENVFGLSMESQEVVCAIFLSQKNQIIGATEISRGALSESVFSVSQVLKAALMHNASNVVVAYNHTSGCPIPSKEDIKATMRLESAGRLMEVQILDHIVIGSETAISIREWVQEQNAKEDEQALLKRLEFSIHPDTAYHLPF